jgi:CHAT domain-containing protein/uncharacterized protein HemY
VIFENTTYENNQDYGIVLKNLYSFYIKIANYEKAELYLFKYLTFYKKVFKEENNEYASIICEIGNLYSRTGNYKKAKPYLFQSLAIRKKIFGEEHKEYGYSLQEIGSLFFVLGEYEKAESYLLQSLFVIKKLLSDEDLYYSIIFNELGNLYSAMNQMHKAEFYYLQSLNITIKSRGENHIDNVGTLNNIGNFYSYLFNYEKAEQYLNHSLAITKRVLGENHPDFADVLRSLGRIYDEMRDFKKAEEYLLKSLTITQNTLGEDHIDYAICLNAIGTMYLDSGNYKKAEPYLLKSSLNIKKVFGENHPNYYTSLLTIGGLYIKLGDYKKAEQCFLKSLDIQNKGLFEEKSEYAITLECLGNLYFKMQDFKTAEKYYILAYTINKKMIDENFIWLTDKEKENYWNKSEIFFLRLSSFSIENNLKSSSINSLAFNANLISKALLLESSIDLNKAVSNSNYTIDKLNFEHLKSDRKQYSKLISDGSDKYDLIKKLDSEADSLEKLLLNHTSQYNDLRESIDINCENIKSNLIKNEVAIEYVRYYDLANFSINYMALVLKPDDEYPQLIKLCSEDELKQYSPEADLYSLYDLIWKPLLPSLTNVKTIYYSPSGLLNNIPFQALYKEENGQREYVMDKFTLHQLTSTRYLALDLKKKEKELIEPSIALFGGINYNDYPNAIIDSSAIDESSEAAFLYKNAIVVNRDIDSTRTGANYLPGTKKEVESISDILKSMQWQVDISEGKNATENKIKSLSGKSSKAILHIATHGFAYPDKEEKRKDLAFSMMRGNDKYKASDNPMIRSGLLFGGANMTWQGKGDSLLNKTNEDGVLTAYELSQLDLSKTKLAVLSACETGKGAIQGSEGTFGLKRALKLAGVDNMIVSLWKVPDDATMEMMTLFYTELANTKKPVSSFETAQKAMRLKYPNEPEKWAGFVFVR